MVHPHSICASRFFNNTSWSYWTLTILLLLSQLTIAQQKKKKSVGPAGGEIEISPLELRETMNDFFYKFERTLTESADSIMLISSDPSIDREALIWKMNAIPVANTAIYNSDPFLGFIDIAVFTYQMKMYFESGAGKDLFGDQKVIAIHALDILWEDLEKIGTNLAPDNDISEGVKSVIEFAEQHPITSSYFVRQSTIPLMTKIQEAEKITFKGLAVDMSQSLDEMRSQISSYMEVLPKQVRWETEYIINNTLNHSDLTKRVDSLFRLLERSVLVLESSSELVDNQRQAAFKDISKERLAITDLIRQERQIILDEIKSERAIIMDELTKQLNLQREATFQDLSNLTNQSLDLTFYRMESLVDKLYWRTVIMTSLLVVLVFIGLIIYKKV